MSRIASNPTTLRLASTPSHCFAVPCGFRYAPILAQSRNRQNDDAVNVLAQLVYWYRPFESDSEKNLPPHKRTQYQKFNGPVYHLNYSEIGTHLNMSERRIGAAMKFLTERGLITKQQVNVPLASGKFRSVMYVSLVIEAVGPLLEMDFAEYSNELLDENVTIEMPAPKTPSIHETVSPHDDFSTGQLLGVVGYGLPFDVGYDQEKTAERGGNAARKNEAITSNGDGGVHETGGSGYTVRDRPTTGSCRHTKTPSETSAKTSLKNPDSETEDNHDNKNYPNYPQSGQSPRQPSRHEVSLQTPLLRTGEGAESQPGESGNLLVSEGFTPQPTLAATACPFMPEQTPNAVAATLSDDGFDQSGFDDEWFASLAATAPDSDPAPLTDVDLLATDLTALIDAPPALAEELLLVPVTAQAKRKVKTEKPIKAEKIKTEKVKTEKVKLPRNPMAHEIYCDTLASMHGGVYPGDELRQVDFTRLGVKFRAIGELAFRRMVVGFGADAYAKEHGFPVGLFITQSEKWLRTGQKSLRNGVGEERIYGNESDVQADPMLGLQEGLAVAETIRACNSGVAYTPAQCYHKGQKVALPRVVRPDGTWRPEWTEERIERKLNELQLPVEFAPGMRYGGKQSAPVFTTTFPQLSAPDTAPYRVAAGG